MLMNLAIDGVIGLVPLLGDLFDFAFKSHSRNAALLSQWLQTPQQTRRSSWAVVLAGGIFLLALTGASVWLAVSAVQWAIRIIAS